MRAGNKSRCVHGTDVTWDTYVHMYTPLQGNSEFIAPFVNTILSELFVTVAIWSPEKRGRFNNRITKQEIDLPNHIALMELYPRRYVNP